MSFPSVSFMLDGESVAGALQGPPNAIGICKVKRLGETYQRYFRHLAPLNEEASTILAVRCDMFVRTERAIAEPIGASAPQYKVDGWTIADVELLWEYWLAQNMELNGRGGRRRERRRVMVVNNMRYLKKWMKDARGHERMVKAGLTDEDRRNPVELLRRIVPLTFVLATEQRRMTDEEVALVHTAQRYLAHFAPAGEMPEAKTG